MDPPRRELTIRDVCQLHAVSNIASRALNDPEAQRLSGSRGRQGIFVIRDSLAGSGVSEGLDGAKAQSAQLLVELISVDSVVGIAASRLRRGAAGTARVDAVEAVGFR